MQNQTRLRRPRGRLAMTSGPGTTTTAAGAADSAHAVGGRRPWYVWAAPFALILVTLCVRNAFLFTRHIYEIADYGADSILIEKARHFDLLVGNYSREGFNHPGPAYFYIMAAGESLFYYALHLVPTPWNAQVIALYVLNSSLSGLVVLVVYGWTRTRGALAAGALLLGFTVAHAGVLSDPWLPYQDVTAFILFLIAAASVAGGHRQDAWIATLAGWLLIHRYAVMLLFVPALTVIALALAVWPARHRLRSAARDMARSPSVWVPVAVISAVFALPIVLEEILHWPGEFGKYLTYSNGSKAGAHTNSQTIHYVLWFWGTGTARWIFLAAVGLSLIAALVMTKGPLRRYLFAALALNAAATVVFVYYAATGIDEINEHYIGYFYWGVPFTTVLAVLMAAVSLLAILTGGQSRTMARGAMTIVATLGAAAALAGFAVAPATATSTTGVDPEVYVKTPGATEPLMATTVQMLAARAHGKIIVVYLYHTAWTEMAGFLVQAERSGVPACLAAPWYEFMVTSQFICTPEQIRHGAWFMFHAPGDRLPGTIIKLRRAVVTSYVPPFAVSHPRHHGHHH